MKSPLTDSIYLRMLQRTLPAGFIAPCLPAKAHTLPSGGVWLHEIKHDGFRKDGERVRLYSRPGHDLTRRFPLIVDALSRLRSRSCIIDGEAVACDRWVPELFLISLLAAFVVASRGFVITNGLLQLLPRLRWLRASRAPVKTAGIGGGDQWITPR